MKAIFTVLILAGMAAAQDMPRVFLKANSDGNTWHAHRDQSMEMAKDFQKNCPDVRISVAQDNADYTVILNHIELGLFTRDNQMEVANKKGDLLATREKGGIKGGVKGVCDIILADWRKPQPPQAAAPAAQSDQQPDQEQAAAQPPQQPQVIQLGQTSDQVRAAFGAPEKVVNLGAKQIYLYKDLKVTFVSEKVADVQ